MMYCLHYEHTFYEVFENDKFCSPKPWVVSRVRRFQKNGTEDRTGTAFFVVFTTRTQIGTETEPPFFFFFNTRIRTGTAAPVPGSFWNRRTLVVRLISAFLSVAHVKKNVLNNHEKSDF
jgi:hypothetical protein